MNEQQSHPNSLSLQDVGYAQHQEIQHLRAELANMQAKLAEREKQFTDALAALRESIGINGAQALAHIDATIALAAWQAIQETT